MIGSVIFKVLAAISSFIVLFVVADLSTSIAKNYFIFFSLATLLGQSCTLGITNKILNQSSKMFNEKGVLHAIPSIKILTPFVACLLITIILIEFSNLDYVFNITHIRTFELFMMSFLIGFLHIANALFVAIKRPIVGSVIEVLLPNFIFVCFLMTNIEMYKINIFAIISYLTSLFITLFLLGYHSLQCKNKLNIYIFTGRQISYVFNYIISIFFMNAPIFISDSFLDDTEVVEFTTAYRISFGALIIINGLNAWVTPYYSNLYNQNDKRQQTLKYFEYIKIYSIPYVLSLNLILLLIFAFEISDYFNFDILVLSIMILSHSLNIVTGPTALILLLWSKVSYILLISVLAVTIWLAALFIVHPNSSILYCIILLVVNVFVQANYFVTVHRKILVK